MKGRKTASGRPDMRCRENRTPGRNADGSLDMRYKANRSTSSPSSGSTFSWYYEQERREREQREREERAMRMRREMEERERREREERERRERAERERREREERERREREKRELMERSMNADRAFASRRIELKSKVLKEQESVLERNVEQAYSNADKKFDESSLNESVTRFLEEISSQEILEGIISEKVNELAPKSTKEIKKHNVILVGKTGVGKSTLLNAVLHLCEDGKEAAETGVGKPVTQGKPREYTSDTLRVWDTKGIEVGTYGAKDVVDDVKEVVDSTGLKNDPDMCIHAIWYCVLTQGSRLEEAEKEALLKFMETYDGGKLPVIVVLTQAYSKKDAEAMKTEIKKIVDGKEIKILPVVAKEKDMDEFCIKPRGIDDLLAETKECAKIAAIPAYQHSLRVQAEKAINDDYSDEFVDKMISDNKKAIVQKVATANQKTGVKDKVSLIVDILNSLLSSWFRKNKGEPLKVNSSLDGVMEVITKWAVDTFEVVNLKLATVGDELFSKYAEEKKKVEGEYRCQISGNASGEWAISDKKEIINNLTKKAENIAFRVVSERAVEVFAKSLSKAFIELVRKKLSSASSQKLMSDVIKKAF